jgi:hypothetical protein
MFREILLGNLWIFWAINFADGFCFSNDFFRFWKTPEKLVSSQFTSQSNILYEHPLLINHTYFPGKNSRFIKNCNCRFQMRTENWFIFMVRLLNHEFLFSVQLMANWHFFVCDWNEFGILFCRNIEKNGGILWNLNLTLLKFFNPWGAIFFIYMLFLPSNKLGCQSYCYNLFRDELQQCFRNYKNTRRLH